jgi:glycerol-3-phosphate cytidylyltransferase-like family protein
MIIQIIGLPGSGKTTLATELAGRINAIHLNADYVRSTINSDLGFTPKDRIEHSRRMGEIAKMLSSQGLDVVVDFICPTVATRSAFGKPDILVWMDTITSGRFEDTNKMWEKPATFDYRFIDFDSKNQASLIISYSDLPDWKAPTTLMLGRYQPWHEGHHALLEKAYEKTTQVVIGVRDTQGTSEKDPLSYEEVADRIRTEERSPFIVKFPNITNIVYGRDVGYKIEQVDLGADIHAISATQKRKEMGI